MLITEDCILCGACEPEFPNERSGLLGISGRSSDMRDLLATRGQDARVALAVEVFCYRVRKYLGAYLATLGGAEAIVFGGGLAKTLHLFALGLQRKWSGHPFVVSGTKPETGD